MGIKHDNHKVYNDPVPPPPLRYRVDEREKMKLRFFCTLQGYEIYFWIDIATSDGDENKKNFIMISACLKTLQCQIH